MTPQTEGDGPRSRWAPAIVRLSDLIGDVEERHHDPLDRVAAACLLGEELRRVSQTLLHDRVAQALESGASWSDIARVLHVSRQAAHRKYRAPQVPRTRAPSVAAAACGISGAGDGAPGRGDR